MSIANWKASRRNNQQISYSDRPFESLLKSNEKDEHTFCFECGKSDSRNAYSQDGEEETFNSLDAMSCDKEARRILYCSHLMLNLRIHRDLGDLTVLSHSHR